MKYGNKKVEIDGHVFDSRKEARRYQELRLLEKAGAIQNLQTQVKFVLIPAQYEPDTIGKRGGIRKGKLIERECSYIADFVYDVPITIEKQYTAKTGEVGTMTVCCGIETVVEDTKGFRTKDYIIKRKLMLHEYGIRIKEI